MSQKVRTKVRSKEESIRWSIGEASVEASVKHRWSILDLPLKGLFSKQKPYVIKHRPLLVWIKKKEEKKVCVKSMDQNKKEKHCLTIKKIKSIFLVFTCDFRMRKEFHDFLKREWSLRIQESWMWYAIGHDDEVNDSTCQQVESVGGGEERGGRVEGE